MVELSIVLGTYNRYGHLAALMDSIRETVTRPYEVVVADGGSTDGTREYLVAQPDVVFIGERALHGAVNAYNKAFGLARGRYVAHLNDDCRLLGGCLDAACALLDADERIGQVALPFIDGQGPPQVNYVHMDGINVLYANFGVLRREVGNALGWWGDYLHTYGGDCELSFRIWEAGYRVAALKGYALHHYREQDELRRENVESRHFLDRWAGRVSRKWTTNDGHTTTD